jgi:ankyrin repeat domain-containing protein 50
MILSHVTSRTPGGMWLSFCTYHANSYLARPPNPERLLSAINSVNPDQFLQILSTGDEARTPITPPLNCDHPRFYWIFRNMDFKQWDTADCSQVLWLCGPPECSIHQASLYIVDLAKKKTLETQHTVLHFFCPTLFRQQSIIITFVHALLYQIVSGSPIDKKISIIRGVLRILIEATLEKERAYDKESCFQEEDSLDTTVKKILDNSTDNGLWGALKAALALADEPNRELSIVVDGLDKVEHQRSEFVKGIHILILYLLERISIVKALLTSRPQAEIKEAFNRIPCIEYDKERKGSATPIIRLYLN